MKKAAVKRFYGQEAVNSVQNGDHHIHVDGDGDDDDEEEEDDEEDVRYKVNGNFFEDDDLSLTERRVYYSPKLPDIISDDDGDDDDYQQADCPNTVQGKKACKPNWTLTERSCSLYSDILNQIMVTRGASSISSGDSNRSQSKSKTSSNQAVNKVHPVKCCKEKCSDVTCQSYHSSEQRQPSECCKSAKILQPISSIYISGGDIVRVKVSGERKCSNESSDKLREAIQQSPGNFGTQREWRKCKHSGEIMLAKSPNSILDYSSNWSEKVKGKVKGRVMDEGKLTAEQELIRFHRQYVCEALSLVVMLMAVFFLIATPFLLIPIWAFPAFNSQSTRLMIWLSLLLSIIFTVIASIIGNIYWYYDSRTSKLTWRLHCGQGPRHFWGSTIFNFANNATNNQDKPTINNQLTSVNITI